MKWLQDKIVKLLFKKPYYTGNFATNLIYFFCHLFVSPPYLQGRFLTFTKEALQSNPHWKYQHGQTLIVQRREWIPAKYNLIPGYHYHLERFDGKTIIFHENWLTLLR
jgi:hypothetical protein